MSFFQDKEGLITELRKELRVSDDEHREILTLVNRDDIIQKIRFECFMSLLKFGDQNNYYAMAKVSVMV
jgi:hypothetical protein